MCIDLANLFYYNCGQNQSIPQRKQSVAKGIRQADRRICSSGMQVGAKHLLSRYYLSAASCEDTKLYNR